MKCRLLLDMDCKPCEDFPEGVKPAGTVIEHPEAFWLVLQGCAEAADEECEKAAPTTPQQQAARLDAYQKIEAGVMPEDREAWDRGWMRGYNPDGSWVPGPNAEEFDELEYEEYKKESRLVLP